MRNATSASRMPAERLSARERHGAARAPSRVRRTRRGRYVGALLSTAVAFVPMPAVMASPRSVPSLSPARGVTLGGDQVAIEGLPLETSLFAQVDGGDWSTLALTRDGRLYAWGQGSNGELGNGTVTSTDVAVAVDMTGALAGSDVVQISMGISHAVVLAADGRLFGWGLNTYGALGAPETPDERQVTRPREIDVSAMHLSGGETITKISADRARTTVLTSTGRLFAWGRNNSGQLGDGTKTDSVTPVSPLPGAMGAAAITDFAVGSQSTMAVVGGRVYAWGANSWGQLGNGSSGAGAESLVPVAVDMSLALSGRVVTGVAAGSSVSVALTQDGKVFTWGSNGYGVLGVGLTDSNGFSPRPVAVDTSGALSGKTLSSVVADHNQVFAVGNDGAVYGWGFNGRGELGNGSTSPTGEPSPVAVDLGPMGGNKVVMLTSGYDHTFAVDEAGRVFGWGDATRGQLGVGATANVTRTTPTLVLTHAVYFGSSDYPATDVDVDLVAGRIVATSPRHAGGDVEVHVVPVFIPDAP